MSQSCRISQYVAAPCSTCGAKLEGLTPGREAPHLITNTVRLLPGFAGGEQVQVEMSIKCGACCPCCAPQGSGEWSGAAPTIAGEQSGLFAAPDAYEVAERLAIQEESR